MSKKYADETGVPYVLIVEDEKRLSEILEAIVARAGFRTITAYDGEAALKLVSQLHPALVLTDVMLPKIDGFELCRRIRSSPEYGHIPVIFLTAKTGPEDKYQGFEDGACDYITKPFDPVELTLRIKAHVQRSMNVMQEDVVFSTSKEELQGTGELKLDPDQLTVVIRGIHIHLSKSQMALLKYLITHKNRIVSVEELSREALCHSPTMTGGRDIVRTQIRNLRLKIEQDPDNPEIIQTIGRAGYTIKNS